MKQIDKEIAELNKQIKTLTKKAADLQAKQKALKTPFLRDAEIENDHITLSMINGAVKKVDEFALIGRRICGEYAHNGIFLGSGETCRWVIVCDEENAWVLVPRVVQENM